MAHAVAMGYGQLTGACTTASAVGRLAWCLKRELACTASRERARLLLNRMMYLGDGAPGARAGRFSGPSGQGGRTRDDAYEEWRSHQRQQSASAARAFGAGRFHE